MAIGALVGGGMIALNLVLAATQIPEWIRMLKGELSDEEQAVAEQLRAAAAQGDAQAVQEIFEAKASPRLQMTLSQLAQEVTPLPGKGPGPHAPDGDMANAMLSQYTQSPVTSGRVSAATSAPPTPPTPLPPLLGGLGYNPNPMVAKQDAMLGLPSGME